MSSNFRAFLFKAFLSSFSVITGKIVSPSTLTEPLSAVSKKFNISRDDILSTKRNKEIAIPRHICVYVARQCTNLSQSQIGKAINRDRTTVISSESFVKETMETDSSFKYEINSIIREISST